ncbi:MAG: hypothetical protein DRI90_15730 [Deltaproteobacteria bacterium]|nr:MAG: hypothetical protein DRI90_15730 [Deltaproteobacteria bacterium]
MRSTAACAPTAISSEKRNGSGSAARLGDCTQPASVPPGGGTSGGKSGGGGLGATQLLTGETTGGLGT